MRYVWIVQLLLSTCIPANAQAEAPRVETHSQLFLPFHFGVIVPGAGDYELGFSAKTGVEYRLDERFNAFARLNYNSSKLKFRNPLAVFPAVQEGKVGFDDLVAGLGCRAGKKKVKLGLLIQSGLSFCAVPVGEVTDSQLSIREFNTTVFTLIPTVIFEYYLDSKTLIAIEISTAYRNIQVISFAKSKWLLDFCIGVNAPMF
ncbi:hypothetical protein [Phaeodactylibacter sp.]|uniref:hypothetical protein n=1 Tax=Phaeodactylibacter sp. TaxID=1940289 RepID=UPI0025D3820C|nr:hypothetical protein [Phaeodactylibacter sp.]MCI4647142.1 hypothetical protein [Phaeodactylibacter sp.]MCI5090870.1 hypothetical protein [Phaeodactylibacter sp.]